MRLRGAIAAAAASVLLLVAPSPSTAAPVTYDFSWVGVLGYTMTGYFSYDDADAADGAIRDGEVKSLYFEGLLNGASIGSNSTAPTLPTFSFNFDATTGQFFLNGFDMGDSGQNWNYNGTGGGSGLGFGAGSFASTLTLDSYTMLGFIENPAPLTATLRVDCEPFPGGGNTGGCFPGPGPFPAPEPGTLALLGLGLAGLAFARRRKQ